MLASALITSLQQHLLDTLRECFGFPNATHRALVVFDGRSELSKLLVAGYRLALPAAEFVDFDSLSPDEILARFSGRDGDGLQAGDLTVLVQSSNFRLNEFRLRVELFKRGLKVIEHLHLGRMTTPEEIEIYVNALAYDAKYLHSTAKALRTRLRAAREVILESGRGSRLVYQGPFEEPRLNIGDYSEAVNAGGQFPIGEVFTELADVTKVNGTVDIYAFGGQDFTVKTARPTPITLIVQDGLVVDTRNSTPEFDQVLEEIRAEEQVWLRELGFGLNRAFSPTRIVTDVGAFERVCGMHVSLGEKHAIYAKPEFSRKHSHFHVDVFPDTVAVYIDGEQVFDGERYIA